MKKLVCLLAVIGMLCAGCAALSALSRIDASVSVPTKNGTVTVSTGDTSGTLTVAYQKENSAAVTTLTLNTASNTLAVASNALTADTVATTITLTGATQ